MLTSAWHRWKKRIFVDIEPENPDIEDFLKQHFNNDNVTSEEINEVLNADFTVPWFYTHNFGDETEQFFIELDNLLKEKSISELNIDTFISENLDKVIYKQEKLNWQKRLLLTAFVKFTANDEETARILYQITQNKERMQELFIFIMKQSVFQYFLNMLSDKSFMKYKQKEVEDNISYLEQLWGFYV